MLLTGRRKTILIQMRKFFGFATAPLLGSRFLVGRRLLPWAFHLHVTATKLVRFMTTDMLKILGSRRKQV